MILDDQQRRALQFIEAANQGGYRPTPAEVTEWVLRPGRRPGKKGDLIKAGTPSVFSQQNAFKIPNFYSLLRGSPDVYGPDGPSESLIKNLLRLVWVEQNGVSGLKPTQLGRALLRTDYSKTEDDEGVTTIVLEANSKLSYAVLLGHIADSGHAFVIDPYIRAEQLWHLLTQTDTTRVLTGPLDLKTTTECQVVLGALSPQIEVRQAKRGALHDRYVIGDRGIHQFGASMNGVGGTATTTLVQISEDIVNAVQELTEAWWNDATVVTPITGPPTNTDTEEGQEEEEVT